MCKPVHGATEVLATCDEMQSLLRVLLQTDALGGRLTSHDRRQLIAA